VEEANPTPSAPAPPTPALVWPAPGPITSPFGGRRGHPGIDIDGVTGDPVLAAGGGTVVLAGLAPSGYSGYGNVVMIDHGGGIATLYAHLSRVDVLLGQTVAQDQRIGAIGATGLATGDHLHFEVRVDNRPTDPMTWLPPR
jgi:murein DD-endopeptidase MepM/ murein hydrolase activator NlpD